MYSDVRVEVVFPQGVNRLVVYTGSDSYWWGLCLFMSLPLTTSVLTQRQEMINTAKRCNVRRRGRRGVEGERGEKQIKYPACYFTLFIISVLQQETGLLR